MPTKDKAKNRQYVAKSRAKSRRALGEKAYKALQAEKQKDYRWTKHLRRPVSYDDKKNDLFLYKVYKRKK